VTPHEVVLVALPTTLVLAVAENLKKLTLPAIQVNLQLVYHFSGPFVPMRCSGTRSLVYTMPVDGCIEGLGVVGAEFDPQSSWFRSMTSHLGSRTSPVPLPGSSLVNPDQQGFRCCEIK
jgi:hypothetical protein